MGRRRIRTHGRLSAALGAGFAAAADGLQVDRHGLFSPTGEQFEGQESQGERCGRPSN